MDKDAPTRYPVHTLIHKRWSPYWFSPRPVSEDDLRSLFEAARWAPSAYNEQPWTYVVARRSDAAAHQRMVACLVEGNRTWAEVAPVLVLGLARLTFARNGEVNGTAAHDLGLASANLCLEATARGISVHQMSGILPDVIRGEYALPEEVSPITALAIGYCAEDAEVPERYHDRQHRERARAPVDEFVFESTWGQASSWL